MAVYSPVLHNRIGCKVNRYSAIYPECLPLPLRPVAFATPLTSRTHSRRDLLCVAMEQAVAPTRELQTTPAMSPE